MKEIWKICVENPSLCVSNFGQVRDIHSGKILPRKWASDRFKIYYHGGVYAIHILVASAFLEKPKADTRLCVCFIDGDFSNIRAENLEYRTFSSIGKESYVPRARWSGIKVRDNTTGKVYDSMKSCQENLGISYHVLRNSIRFRDTSVVDVSKI